MSKKEFYLTGMLTIREDGETKYELTLRKMEDLIAENLPQDQYYQGPGDVKEFAHEAITSAAVIDMKEAGEFDVRELDGVGWTMDGTYMHFVTTHVVPEGLDDKGRVYLVTMDEDGTINVLDEYYEKEEAE